jgi:hypothetical protein
METDPGYLFRVVKAAIANMEEVYRIEDAVDVAQRKNVKDILLEAGPRRLGYVRELALVPRPKAMGGIMMLLDVVAPGLKSPNLTAPPAHEVHDGPRCISPILYRDTFDLHLLNAGLSFASLT